MKDHAVTTDTFDDVPVPVHDVRTRWRNVIEPATHGRPELSIGAEVVHFATAFGDWDLVPVVGADGGVVVCMRQRGIYVLGDGTWGCATCEQSHPIEVKSCPLLMKDTVLVAVGPFYHDGDQITFVGATVATDSFVHGSVVSGVGIWRADDIRWSPVR